MTSQRTTAWRGAMTRWAMVPVLLIACVAAARGEGAAPAPASDPRQLMGIDKVETRLGRQAPTGRGIVAAHIEGGAEDYLPQVMSDEFRGVTFVPQSGASRGNGHADATARIIYGRKGLAPGVERVLCMASRHWLQGGGLRAGTPHPPRDTEARVMTHSWIADGSPLDAQMLRRLDHLIDAQGVTVVVGVNNNPQSPVPALLASAYNVIAVGQYDGKSSGGYTMVETAGRCKPDLVAPGSLTSFSTPAAAAAAARLLEAAAGARHEGAGRPETIKAALMAGAEKPANWRPAAGKPLDEHFGAGRVRLDRSLEILGAAGPAMAPATRAANDAIAANVTTSQSTSQPATLPARAPSGFAHERSTTMLRNRCGWVMGSIAVGGRHEFRLETPRDLGEASLVLVWHRRIDGRTGADLLTGEPLWLDLPRMADLDLRLEQRDDSGAARPVAQSASAIDNVEHIHLQALPAGHYTLWVIRNDTLDEPWTYTLAWWIAGPR